MKCLYQISVLAFFFISWCTPALAISFTGTQPETQTQLQNQSLLHTISDLQDQKQHLLSKQIELRQEEERGEPSRTEIDEINARIETVNQMISSLKAQDTPDSEAIRAQETQKVALEADLEAANRSFQNESDNYQQRIELLTLDIKEAQAEVDKLQELAETQGYAFAMRMTIFLSIVIFLLIARFFTRKMIRRMSGKIPAQREVALVKINKISFNVLIVITILVGIFSQLISFLPFLAILGTALAFALRDIISSFIAWFILGTDQGYRIGDLIQTGKLRGRVLEIHPLLTVIRQTGLRGDTGRIVSFPNKFIFEKEVQNFSKLYRFIYIMLDFILERNSDIDAAKNTLRETILEVIVKDHDEAEKSLPGLQRKFSMTSNNIEPQIFIEPDPRGILLRGKYFVRLENRHKSRSEITEKFLRKVQKMDNIQLRLMEFGEEHKSNLDGDQLNF